MERICDVITGMGDHCSSRDRKLGMVYTANTVTNLSQNSP